MNVEEVFIEAWCREDKRRREAEEGLRQLQHDALRSLLNSAAAAQLRGGPIVQNIPFTPSHFHCNGCRCGRGRSFGGLF